MYGKTHRHENGYHRRNLYSQIRINKRHSVLYKATWESSQVDQETEGERETNTARALIEEWAMQDMYAESASFE